MTSPDRLLARLLVSALAFAGSLSVVLLVLVDAGVAPTIGGAQALWCVIVPVSSVDGMLHLSALVVWLFGAGIVLAAVRSIRRERVVGRELRGAVSSTSDVAAADASSRGIRGRGRAD